jgi:16S rRNA (cytidine1402-2'-O)-methyltransferase
MPTLYIVATPIGNLKDIGIRALEVLRSVDLILCEDKRVTQKLLFEYQIEKPLLSYHQHSKIQKIDHIISLLKEGKNLALVSDAGTPSISDAGGRLIEKVTEIFGDKIKIIPVPGPCALTCAASVSGFPMDRFLFLGFPPKKKKRKKFFKEVLESKYPVIFYESPYRVIKTLSELQGLAKNLNLEPKVVVARELTKKFETIYRGKIGEVIEKIKNDKIKGEFVIIIRK